jgi:hypothetical protein
MLHTSLRSARSIPAPFRHNFKNSLMIRFLQNRYTLLLINLMIVGFLLLLWTSDSLIWYYTSDFFIEGLKLFGLSILVSLGYLFIDDLITYKLLFHDETKSRVIYAIIIIIIVFGYKYVQYTKKIVVISDSKRIEINQKLKRINVLNGTGANGLTYDEYFIVKDYIGLPKIPTTSYDINYTNSFDGFLPDYMTTMEYKIPLETPIKNFKFERGDYSRYQHVDTFLNYKKVIYEEILR